MARFAAGVGANSAPDGALFRSVAQQLKAGTVRFVRSQQRTGYLKKLLMRGRACGEARCRGSC